MPCPRYIVQQPAKFAAGKIGIDNQTCFQRDDFAMAAALELFTKIGSPAVLPNDRIMDRLTAPAIPNHRRLPLICHPNGRDISSLQTGLGQSLPSHSQLAAPDLTRIMLHPSGPWIDLWKF